MKSVLVSVLIGLFSFITITAGLFLILSLYEFFSGAHTLKLEAIMAVSLTLTLLGAIVAWKNKRVADSHSNWFWTLFTLPWW